jgi:hypothetical protein
MTKTAYVNLYTKLDSLQPGTCMVACNGADRKATDEYNDVKCVIYHQQMSPKPDDGVAGDRALGEAQGMAAAAYAGDWQAQAGAFATVAVADKNVKLR